MRNKLETPLFPEKDTSLCIQGPAGRLELAVSLPRENPKPIMGVVCHPHPLYGGTMENKVVTTIARAFRDMHIPSVRFNFRGVGNSEGTYDHGIGEGDDLLAVLRWLKKVRPEHDLWLAGFSFGAYVAFKASSLWPIQQLILVAPAVTNFDFKNTPLPACPWMVIQGEEDEVVEPEAVFQWVASLKPPPKLIRLPHATHFFHGRLVELREILQRELQP